MFKQIQRIVVPALMLVPFSTAWSLEMVNEDGSVWEAGKSSALHWEPEMQGIATDLPIESFASLTTWPDGLDVSKLVPAPAPGAEPSTDAAERVLGADGRRRVSKTNRRPARYSGAMSILNRYICTGALFGPRVIQTAAHCLVINGQRVSASNVLFAPGANRKNGQLQTPYGVCRGVSSAIPAKYLNSQSFDYDWALIKLDCSVGNRTGFFGYKARARKRQKTKIWGYPGDKTWPTQWKDSCNLIGVTKRRIAYRCDTAGGQSGSGVWKKFSGCGKCLFGVHTSGGTSSNGGTKLKKSHVTTMRAWRRM